jgi:uncharacterized protein (DUF302 family)
MKRTLCRLVGTTLTLAAAWLVVHHVGPQGRATERTPAAAEPLKGFPDGSTQSRYEVTHLTIASAKPVERLRADFESIVRRANFDIFSDLSPEEMKRRLLALSEKDGFLILAQSDVGARQSLIVGHTIKAKTYFVGNPLIAAKMIGAQTAAALYVPLRVLIYEDERGRAVISYDQPSSFLGQFGDALVLEVARTLDRKLGEIARRAAE